jgi:ribosomal protein L37AE/L43A
MGSHVPNFKCPKCETLMGEGANAPNWTTIITSSAGQSTVVGVLSCTKCNTAFAGYSVDTRR